MWGKSVQWGGADTKKQKRSDVEHRASIFMLFPLRDMILSFWPSELKQSSCKFRESLLGHAMQELSSIEFLLAGQDLLYRRNKRLVCCSCDSHHGDFVWAHDRVGAIVSLQICHSVCQRGSKHNSPFSENMADIWKIPPSNNSYEDCNYMIKTHCLRSFSNGAPLALLVHTCGSGKRNCIRIRDCLCSTQGTMSCIWIFITRLWC